MSENNVTEPGDYINNLLDSVLIENGLEDKLKYSKEDGLTEDDIQLLKTELVEEIKRKATEEESNAIGLIENKLATNNLTNKERLIFEENLEDEKQQIIKKKVEEVSSLKEEITNLKKELEEEDIKTSLETALEQVKNTLDRAKAGLLLTPNELIEVEAQAQAQVKVVELSLVQTQINEYRDNKKKYKYWGLDELSKYPYTYSLLEKKRNLEDYGNVVPVKQSNNTKLTYEEMIDRKEVDRAIKSWMLIIVTAIIFLGVPLFLWIEREHNKDNFIFFVLFIAALLCIVLLIPGLRLGDFISLRLSQVIPSIASCVIVIVICIYAFS